MSALLARPATSASATSRPALTPRERLVYLEHRLAPGAPTNVMVARFAVDGGVDVGRLRHAVDALLAETESLRTVVRDQDGEPRPVIIPPRPVHVPLIDLRDAPDPSAALDAWLGDRAPLPFCLDRLLIEFFLARLAEDRHVVVIRQHHLITDAESHALLWRRLTELYGGTAGEALLPMSVHRSAERAYRESDLAGKSVV